MSARKSKASDHANPEMVQYVLDGVSKSVLAKIFGVHRTTVIERLRGVAPDGHRGTNPIYKIANVAPLLLKMNVNTDTDVDYDDPTTMAPDMRKDYWDARAKEMKAMELAGDLWPTEKVLHLLIDVFKEFRMGVALFSDAVDRETELTNEQRGMINALSDELIETMRRRMEENITISDSEGADDEGVA